MAEFTSDKSLPPTPHRREQARREGKVAHSPDLASAVLLIAALLALWTLGGRLVEFVARLTQRQLGGEAWAIAEGSFSAADNHTLDSIAEQGQALLLELAQILAPVLGTLLFAAIVSNLAQTGFRWHPERLMPDVRRINPIAGLRRIFSFSGGERLIMGLAKLLCVSVVAYWSLWQRREEIVNVAALDVAPLAALVVDITLWTSFKITLALFVLALADYAYQRWKLERDLRMTPQELREEMKNLQGDPQLITRRHAMQRQQALDRLIATVPQATVVVTGGHQLAVAIQFDPATMSAPVVVAKGAGDVAERIRQAAQRHGVPLINRPKLAQSLYREVGFNMPIPETLHDPLAQLLAEAYQRQRKTHFRKAA